MDEEEKQPLIPKKVIRVIGKEHKKTVEMWAREIGIESEDMVKLEVDRNIVSYF